MGHIQPGNLFGYFFQLNLRHGTLHYTEFPSDRINNRDGLFALCFSAASNSANSSVSVYSGSYPACLKIVGLTQTEQAIYVPTASVSDKEIVPRGKVKYYGEHVFRHTFATNCYYKGIDIKILSRLMGHSSVQVTYNTYVNLYGDGFDDMYAALCF